MKKSGILISILLFCNLIHSSHTPGAYLQRLRRSGRPSVSAKVLSARALAQAFRDGREDAVRNLITPDLMPQETRKEVVRQYFLMFGEDINNQVLYATGVSKQDIYGFSVQELIDNERIPPIHRITKKLRLNNLYINDLIGLQAIPGIANIKELLLSHNFITELPLNIFQGMNNLKKLALNDNQLTNLPPNIFQGLNSLIKLELNSNQLIQLSPNIFQGPSNLRRINLRFNKIAQLPANVFDNLPNLEHIDLRNNGPTAIPQNIVDNFGGIMRL